MFRFLDVTFARFQEHSDVSAVPEGALLPSSLIVREVDYIHGPGPTSVNRHHLGVFLDIFPTQGENRFQAVRLTSTYL